MQHRVEVFFDGECPLCVREIDMLKGMDKGHGILFTDISASDFDPASVGKTYPELMAKIQGRLADGTWLEGVEVFRQLYATVGFKRLVRMSRLPGVSQVLDLGYQTFAKNRLRLTGRCDDACRVPAA